LGLLVHQQWNWRENQALTRRVKNAKLRGNPCVEDIDYRAARGLDKSVIRALTQESGWVKNHENIFVLGPTGVGKRFSARQFVISHRPLYLWIPRPYVHYEANQEEHDEDEETDFGNLSCGKSQKSKPKGTRYQRDQKENQRDGISFPSGI
jgi:hypothetical protein